MKIIILIIVLVIIYFLCYSIGIYTNSNNMRHNYIHTELMSFDDIDEYIKGNAFTDIIVYIICLIAICAQLI